MPLGCPWDAEPLMLQRELRDHLWDGGSADENLPPGQGVEPL